MAFTENNNNIFTWDNNTSTDQSLVSNDFNFTIGGNDTSMFSGYSYDDSFSLDGGINIPQTATYDNWVGVEDPYAGVMGQSTFGYDWNSVLNNSNPTEADFLDGGMSYDYNADIYPTGYYTPNDPLGTDWSFNAPSPSPFNDGLNFDVNSPTSSWNTPVMDNFLNTTGTSPSRPSIGSGAYGGGFGGPSRFGGMTSSSNQGLLDLQREIAQLNDSYNRDALSFAKDKWGDQYQYMNDNLAFNQQKWADELGYLDDTLGFNQEKWNDQYNFMQDTLAFDQTKWADQQQYLNDTLAFNQDKWNQQYGLMQDQFAFNKDMYAQDAAFRQSSFNTLQNYREELRQDQNTQFNNNLAWQKSKFASIEALDRDKMAEAQRQFDQQYQAAQDRFNFNKALSTWQNNLAAKQSQFQADVTNRNLYNQATKYNYDMKRQNNIANALGRAAERKSIDPNDLLSKDAIDYSVNAFSY